MTKVIPDFAKADAVRIGPQPIAIAAAALIVIVLGIGMALLWRAYTGSSREQDRDTLVRLLRAQATQASEQLAEKTNSLETRSRRQSTSCRLFRINCRRSGAFSPRSKLIQNGCPSRLKDSQAQSTRSGNLSPALSLRRHLMRARLRRRRSGHDPRDIGSTPIDRANGLSGAARIRQKTQRSYPGRPLPEARIRPQRRGNCLPNCDFRFWQTRAKAPLL